MIRTPYFHQTDPNKMPGQIRFPVVEDMDEPSTVPSPELVNLHPPHSLGEYLQQKYGDEFLTPKKPKLTFEEWVNTKPEPVCYFGLDNINTEFAGETWFMFECIWNAAQENK
jgi:hypothetical protein